MPLIADDEPILNVIAPIVPYALRFHKATLLLVVPRVDADGVSLPTPLEFELEYENPTLTDAQRSQFIATAKFIAKKNGVIT